MKRLRLILLTISVGIMFFAIYFLLYALQKNTLENLLTSEIANMQQEGITCCLEMQKITNFEWDKLLIFLPFTVPGHMEDMLGFEWNDASQVSQHSRDDMYLLVFVKENRVVEYLEFQSSKGLLFDLYHPSEFTPNEAFFEVAPPR